MFKFKDTPGHIIGGIKQIHKDKYFYPFIIAMGFCLLSLAVLYVGSAPRPSQIKEGNISARTIYAPYDFTYPTTIDEDKTEEAREAAQDKIALIYDIDSSIQEKAFAKLDNFFNVVKTMREEASSARIDFALSDKDLEKFLESKDLERVRKTSKDALENIFLVGIVSAEEKEGILKKDIEKVLIRNSFFEIEREVKPKDLVDEKEAARIVHDTLERMIRKDRPMRNAVYNIVKGSVVVNARFNIEETSKRKDRARNQVLSVYRRKTVKKNELVVEKGKRLTKDDITKLTQITHIHFIVNRAAYITGLAYATANRGGDHITAYIEGPSFMSMPFLIVENAETGDPLSEEDALKRMMYIMINEAARCLEEGVIDEPESVLL